MTAVWTGDGNKAITSLLKRKLWVKSLVKAKYFDRDQKDFLTDFT
jgi:hypothetical protein